MRSKIVIPVLLLAAFGLAVLLLLHFHQPNVPSKVSTQPAPEEARSGRNAAPEKIATAAAVDASPGAAQKSPEPDEFDTESPQALQEAYVKDRILELERLGMTDSHDALAIIVSELSNRDPRIRKAAIEAAVQFGSQDAIPALLDAISLTDDLEEKAALQKAADFLKLPKLAIGGK